MNDVIEHHYHQHYEVNVKLKLLKLRCNEELSVIMGKLYGKESGK